MLKGLSAPPPYAKALSAASGDNVDEAREAIIKEFEEKGKTEKAFEELAKTHSEIQFI